MPKRIQLEYQMTQFYSRREYIEVKEGDRDTYWNFLKSYFPPKNILTTEEIRRRTLKAAKLTREALTDYGHHSTTRLVIASTITNSLSTCTNYDTTLISQKELTEGEMLELAKKDKKQLISFAVRFLKDYSTFSIFHPLRSHRTEVEHLCTALINLPIDGSWNFSDFEKFIDTAVAEAKTINPHGAFQRRITFLREVAALLEGMYSGTEPKPVASATVRAAGTAASAPLSTLSY